MSKNPGQRVSPIPAGSRIGGSASVQALYPFFGFTLIVVLYNWLFLGQGFNATDEGYLLSLGQRIANGAIPYVDFFFLRTPLSIYLQAWLLELFGDNYTVLASRIYWSVQMWLGAIVLSGVYYRVVSRFETFLLLLATWVISSLLLSFPWYSYDAAFFAIVAVVCLSKRWFFVAGICAALAGLTKQNYFFLVPLVLAGVWGIQFLAGRIRMIGFKSTLVVLLGFVVPIFAYAIYLGANGWLHPCLTDVFSLPQEASRMTVSWTLFQDNLAAIVTAVPTIASITLLFYYRPRSYLMGIGVLLLSVASMAIAVMSHRSFVFCVLYANYTAAVLILISVFRSGRSERDDRTSAVALMTIVGIVLQYLAGFNYYGVEYAYMGVGVLVSAAYVGWQKFSPSPSRNLISLLFMSGLLLLGMYHKYSFVYRDGPRGELNTPFKTEKLSGIISAARNVQQVDSLVALIRSETREQSPIFVFPDFPILYYLTDRRNPTPIEWYAPLELGEKSIQAALAGLQRAKPSIALVQKYPEGDFSRVGDQTYYSRFPRYVSIAQYLDSTYTVAGRVGDMMVMKRRMGK